MMGTGFAATSAIDREGFIRKSPRCSRFAPTLPVLCQFLSGTELRSPSKVRFPFEEGAPGEAEFFHCLSKRRVATLVADAKSTLESNRIIISESRLGRNRSKRGQF
jgi:hypothetical protein